MQPHATVFALCLALFLPACSKDSGSAPELETTTPVPSPENRAEAAGWGEGTWMDQHRAILVLASPGSEAFAPDAPPPVPTGDIDEPDVTARRGLDLVFLGDSITQGWGGPGRRVAAPGGSVWNRRYGGAAAANFGIAGDRTQHVLWRIDHGEFDLIAPKAIVVMIGTNNIGTDTPQDIAAGVTAVVDALAEKAPRATVLLMSIVRGCDANDSQRQVANEVNELISKLGDRGSVRYVDLGAVFYGPNGAANSALLAGDCVHFTPDGYEAWARAIQPELDELLN